MDLNKNPNPVNPSAAPGGVSPAPAGANPAGDEPAPKGSDFVLGQHLPGVVTTQLQKVINWGRKSSIWYLTFGLACCATEDIMAAGAAHWDLDRFGMFFRASPRQADVMFVAGTVTEKMAPRVRQLWEQMAEPRYVIAIGSCAISGGPFAGGYNTVLGVDKVIPVDVYVPGCPPRPEALYYGVLKLQEKIKKHGLPEKKDKGMAAAKPVTAPAGSPAPATGPGAGPDQLPPGTDAGANSGEEARP